MINFSLLRALTVNGINTFFGKPQTHSFIRSHICKTNVTSHDTYVPIKIIFGPGWLIILSINTQIERERENGEQKAKTTPSKSPPKTATINKNKSSD